MRQLKPIQIWTLISLQDKNEQDRKIQIESGTGLLKTKPIASKASSGAPHQSVTEEVLKLQSQCQGFEYENCFP